jgi:hypothetical protein
VEDSDGHLLTLRARLNLPDTGYFPHITIMHPRNSTCTDQTFAAIKQIQLPEKLSISSASLIEQRNGQMWRTLRSYPFD